MKIEGLPVIDVDESEEITVAVRADDLHEGDTSDPERHPIAIALKRQDDVDDARLGPTYSLVNTQTLCPMGFPRKRTRMSSSLAKRRMPVSLANTFLIPHPSKYAAWDASTRATKLGRSPRQSR